MDYVVSSSKKIVRQRRNLSIYSTPEYTKVKCKKKSAPESAQLVGVQDWCREKINREPLPHEPARDDSTRTFRPPGRCIGIPRKGLSGKPNRYVVPRSRKGKILQPIRSLRYDRLLSNSACVAPRAFAGAMRLGIYQ